MNRILTTLFLAFTLSTAFGQTADEINAQAKVFLTKGDTKNAVPLLKKSAEMGQSEAQYNYAVCFEQGVDVEKNDSVANIWLLKSAKQGWLDAQFKIAYNYALGRGIKQDYKQAFYWSVKCAEQNDPECIGNVIACYSDGKGTIRNPDSASIWTIKLASLPDVENLQQSGMITSARKTLALKYRDGEYYPKDKIKSYMWFLIYNESKRDFSILEQQSSIEAIKELEKKLTPIDKRKAGQMAVKQIGRPLRNLENLYRQDL
jgi:TPR repeat protein